MRGTSGKGTSNTAPMVNAGPDLSATLGVPLSIAGSATDDGLPNPPGTIAYQWKVKLAALELHRVLVENESIDVSFLQ